VLGIDEPNVVSEGGSEAADAAPDRVTEAGPDRVVDAGPDEVTETGPDRGTEAGPDQVAEVGPDEAAEAALDADASDSSDSVAAPTNLITNGNFSMGQTDWVIQGSGTITTPAAGQLCVSVVAGQTTILAWTPGKIALSMGASYTFSYSAKASPAVTVDAKIAPSMNPFTPTDFETPSGSDAVSTSFSAFAHTFAEPNPNETSAGVAFTIPQPGNTANAGTVCFESVSLVQN
jgi:hypothetical protein